MQIEDSRESTSQNESAIAWYRLTGKVTVNPMAAPILGFWDKQHDFNRPTGPGQAFTTASDFPFTTLVRGMSRERDYGLD